jgi:hypothetical protein
VHQPVIHELNHPKRCAFTIESIIMDIAASFAAPSRPHTTPQRPHTTPLLPGILAVPGGFLFGRLLPGERPRSPRQQCKFSGNRVKNGKPCPVHMFCCLFFFPISLPLHLCKICILFEGYMPIKIIQQSTGVTDHGLIIG